MFKRVVLALAVLALVPAGAMADGVEFGFMGGAMGIGAGTTGPTLTTSPSVGGIAPIFEYLRHLPSGPAWGGGANFGTIDFTTADWFTSQVVGGTNIDYFGVGGSFTITANATFSALTGGLVAPGAVLFNGTFSDITTSQFLANALHPPPGATPGGSGAAWYTLPSCPGTLAQYSNCSRLFASLSGTLDPGLVAWLGLSGSVANGWVAQLDIAGNGNIYNITFGDAALYVPEPGTLALFGTGLVGIAGILRRKLVV